MNIIAGHCGKCGAPYTSPLVWHGITPPPMTPTCACWNIGQTISSTRLIISIPGDDDGKPIDTNK